MVDSVRTASDGKLIYRSIDVERMCKAAYEEDRFMFEGVIWLTLFGSLPRKASLHALWPHAGAVPRAAGRILWRT